MDRKRSDKELPQPSRSRRIAILGRKQDTGNYEIFLQSNGFEPLPTLNPNVLHSCGGLLLPGGGDITPAFFGEYNQGSRNIDTELDILQFQALELCLQLGLPVLGICKGMQVINVTFGGTITQDMPDSRPHRFTDRDQYHPTAIAHGSLLYALYGDEALVNSAHHQCICRPGKGLHVIQRCTLDGCPEALAHERLPVLGVQWHPERLDKAHTKLSGALVLSVFATGHEVLT